MEKNTRSSKKAEAEAATTSQQFVAKGTYGCVMRPSVSCAKQSDKQSGKQSAQKHTPATKRSSRKSLPSVSKLFTKTKYAMDEFNAHELMMQMDPTGIFTIQAQAQCEISSDKFNQSELEKCRAEDGKFKLNKDATDQKLHQIIFDDGGIDLRKNFKSRNKDKAIGFKELFVGMHSLFDGLIIMQNNNLAHVDIKPANIVYNPETKKMSLIDFGLCERQDLVYTEHSTVSYGHPYVYYPPEFVVYENATNEDEEDQIAANRNFIEMIDDLGLKHYKFGKDFVSYLWRDWYTMLDKMKHDNFIKHKWSSLIDVYMLGVTILEIWVNSQPNDNTCHSKPFVQ